MEDPATRNKEHERAKGAHEQDFENPLESHTVSLAGM